MSARHRETMRVGNRPWRMGTAGFGLISFSLILFFGMIVFASSKIDSTQLPGSPLVGKTWVRTGGPMGGRGYDIRMRPDNPDIMYVTDQFTGIHKSTDGGLSWFPINEGIDARAGSSGDAIPTFCLTIDPNNYDIIWVGTLGFRGVYRSDNGGLTWEKRINGIVEDSQLTLRGFAIEPGNSKVVYAAGDINLGKRTWYDATKGVVYKTIDGGLNWEAIWRGDNVARYVLIDPTNVKTLYVSTGIWDREAANSNLAADIPGGVGILKSTDGGATWTTINNGLENLYVGSLFMHPTNPRILLAGVGFGFYPSGNGAYLTIDGGNHWTRVLNIGGLITSVEISAKDPNIMWAGGLGFYQSVDGGSTWTQYSGQMGFWGPPGVRLGNPIDFQADPRNSARLFTNNYDGGNVLSDDGGRTWIESSRGYVGSAVTALTVLAHNSSVVYASEKGGPYASTNGGRVWHGINNIRNMFPPPNAQKIAIDPTDPTHLVMSEGIDARVYESHDGGNTWDMILDFREEIWANHSAGAGGGMGAITYAPSQPKKVYGGFGKYFCGQHWLPDETQTYVPIMSLLISEDGGHTWSRREGTALDGSSVTEIVVHPTNADLAWASTYGAGVFQTSDGGLTWQSVSTGLTARADTSLALNLQNPNELYVGTVGSGLFKTDDGGATWRQVIAGLNPNENIISVVIDPIRPHVVYAASEFSGVYLSEDAGDSWRLINNGLRTRAAKALAISPDGLVLYAGTDGEGVFRLGDDLTAPTISGITPAVGPSTGGTVVTIQGSGFVGGGTSVTFGGVPGTSVHVVSSAYLTVVAPAHAAGAVPVAVTTANGAGSLAGGFTYVVTPTMFIRPVSLRFAASKSGVSGGLTVTTTAQNVTVGFTGAASSWTAVADQPWIQVTNGTGTGAGQFTVGIINPNNVLGGVTGASGNVMITSALYAPQAVSVNLTMFLEGTNPPLGVVDTPADGTTGIEGSVPVTGWAVDDIEVISVKIYRDPGEGEQAGPNGYVYIGDAVFVEGARPDVEQAYPNYPLTFKAGWGYMLLTNFLPNGGNGTFRLTAIATDKEGKTTTLGSKTITCDNAHAVLPFGAIDVPSQGGLASGSSFINYAWVLATGRKCISTDGSTITAWVDGLPIGHPNYGYYRVDIATLFPGYCNANGAIGFIPIDTTKYANGVHTIVWSATDSAGVNNGFGSRYFTIRNGGGGAGLEAHNLSTGRSLSMEPGKDTGTVRQLEDIPRDTLSPLHVRRGFDLNQPPETVFPGKDGRVDVDIRELERVAVYLDAEGASLHSERELPEISPAGSEKNPLSSRFDQGERHTAFLVVGNELRPLPIGSTFDADRGVLVWQPGPGFFGDYQFVFVNRAAGLKKNLRIRIRPQ